MGKVKDWIIKPLDHRGSNTESLFYITSPSSSKTYVLKGLSLGMREIENLHDVRKMIPEPFQAYLSLPIGYLMYGCEGCFRYVSILKTAPGIPLKMIFTKSRDHIITIFKKVGRTLRKIHGIHSYGIYSFYVHGDFHLENIFVNFDEDNPEKSLVCFIDNESMAISLKKSSTNSK
jgi:hypothetical protein